MKQRYIHTRFWNDKKVRACTWCEKLVLEYFQLCPEMTIIGAATTTLEKVEIMINGESRRNYITPEFPWIEAKHVDKALNSIRKRGIIDIQNKAGLTVYFYNFLHYNPWGPSVYKSFPDLVDNQVPEGPIQSVIIEHSIRWMKKLRVEIPEAWR